MLDDSTGPTLLTYQEAATRVGKPVRTINRWRAGGMPMTSGVRDGQRVRLVDETVLLAWWRARMNADPVHQLRMHAIAVDEAREKGLPEPERPRATRRQNLPVPPPPSEPSPYAESESDEYPVAVFVPALTTAELLTALQLKAGAQEYSALTRALARGARVACADEPLFTADTLSPLEERVMEGICAECPMLELCAAFAEASRPTSGFWAGASWPRRAARLVAVA